MTKRFLMQVRNLSMVQFPMILNEPYLFLNRSINFLLDFSYTAVQMSLIRLLEILYIAGGRASRQQPGVEAPARTTLPSVDAADVR